MLETITQTKICTRCKEEKELNCFGKRSMVKSGLKSWCKSCNKAYADSKRDELNKYAKTYREKNREAVLKTQNEYYNKNKDDLLDKKRVYYIENKEKITEYKKEYRAKNKEYIAQKNKLYVEKNKEHLNKYIRKYREENKEYLKNKRKEFRNSPNGKAILAHRNSLRRLVIKKSNTTPSQIMTLQQNAKTCYWCGIKLKKNIKIHVDHYNPIANGGEHEIENLVISCSSCNQKKNAKDPFVFANSIGKLL